jgi:hypothetical protein
MKLTFATITGKIVERDATPEEIENLKAMGWEPPNEEAPEVDGDEATDQEGGEGDGEDGEGEAAEEPKPVTRTRRTRR